MISFVRAANAPYRIDCGMEDVDDICNSKEKKTVPARCGSRKDGLDLSQGVPGYARTAGKEGNWPGNRG
ncbi:MAG: hypothetical protein ACLTLQ_08670 [[Clostridium] scindens]